MTGREARTRLLPVYQTGIPVGQTRKPCPYLHEIRYESRRHNPKADFLLNISGWITVVDDDKQIQI